MHPVLIIIIIILGYQGTEAIGYRLPETVLPVNYDIITQLNPDAFITEKFKGEVNITLRVLQQTQEIQLHAKNLSGIHFDLTSTSTTYNISNSNYIADPVTDIITITIKEVLMPGVYHLLGSYDGILDRYDPHGLYKSSYENSGHREYLANTEMALTSARKVFPCWDEPQFKSTFNLTVIYPKGYTVLANSLQNGSVRQRSNTLDVVNFEKTPAMSTYLVAFVVSNFTCSTVSSDILYRVCSRPGSEHERRYALEIAQKSVQYLGNFTGVAYNISGLGKIDLVALPYLQETGMENWGIIYFIENALLYNEYFSSNAIKQRIATLINHEISHMWFGNLVTVKWWSDTFLNEGLATYFEYFATAEVEKDWELDKQFVIDRLQTALAADSSKASPPLSYDVRSPEQIWERFDAISYSKGASIVRMIAHAIGFDNFQRGIKRYLEKNKFSNALAADLWSSLEDFSSLEHSLVEIAQNWTYKPGYPVVNATINGTNVILTQECFLSPGTSTKWYVPITYTTSRNPKKFLNTSTKIWLTPSQTRTVIENKILEKSDWVVLNNLQTGYYRIRYDDNLWSRIEKVLRKSPDDIHVINRAQIVDDLFNFAKTGKISHSKVLDRILFLKSDAEYYSWQVAFRGLDPLLSRSRGIVRTRLESYVSELMSTLYQTTPFMVTDPSSHIYSIKQTMAVTWACRLNVSDCIQNSKKIFAAYRTGLRPNKNLFLPVCCTSLKNSDNVERDWTFLWSRFKESNIANEQREILQALGCTRNQTVLNRFLHWGLNESLIERQNSLMVWRSVLTGTTEGVNVTLEFLIDHYREIEHYYGNDNIIEVLIISLASMLMEQSQVDKLGTLRNKFSNEVEDIVVKAVIVANSNLESSTRLKSELEKYFKIGKKSSSVRLLGSIYLCFILICISCFTS